MAAERGTWKDFATWLVVGLVLGVPFLIWGFSTMNDVPTCGGSEMGPTSQCKRVGSSSTVDYEGRRAANLRTGLFLMAMGGGCVLFCSYKGYRAVSSE
ncbi:hypothetical protein ACFVMC_30540 [Nocardia sp. NPDC127579]|uniref:hypothetical protein n=1 Tax=Nocardia sp. NPDC127579 TaxID=3345402 RepID=UPI0036445472